MEIRRLSELDHGLVDDILGHHLDPVDIRERRPSAAHIHRLLLDGNTYLLAAIEGGSVLGYALAYRFHSLYAEEQLAYLYDIEVAIDRRRTGIGRQLIDTLLPLLRSDGVSELWLGTGTGNVAGQALFSRTGAVKTGETFHDFTYHLDR